MKVTDGTGTVANVELFYREAGRAEASAQAVAASLQGATYMHSGSWRSVQASIIILQ